MTADLSGIRSLLAGITPGPWELDWSGNVVQSLDLVVRTGEHTLEREGIVPAEYVRGDDAAFIAAAPSTVARLLGIVERVEKVHEPIEALMYSGSHQRLVKVCTGCGTDDGNWQRWPCPTIKAIREG